MIGELKLALVVSNIIDALLYDTMPFLSIYRGSLLMFTFNDLRSLQLIVLFSCYSAISELQVIEIESNQWEVGNV